MNIPRFYYQYLENWWCIFDREVLDKSGSCIPIAHTNERYQAIKVTGALNYWDEHFINEDT